MTTEQELFVQNATTLMSIQDVNTSEYTLLLLNKKTQIKIILDNKYQ